MRAKRINNQRSLSEAKASLIVSIIENKSNDSERSEESFDLFSHKQLMNLFKYKLKNIRSANVFLAT